MHFVESVLVLPLLKLILSQGLQCRPQLGLYLQVLIVVIGTTSLSAFPPFSGRVMFPVVQPLLDTHT